jgi:hypothetical protein
MQYALLAIYDSEIEMLLQQDEDDDLLNSPSTSTVTSPRRSPRKIANSDRTSSMMSMTPLLSRTLSYGQDEKDDEEVAAATRGTTQQSAGAESPQKMAGKVFCDAENCPGRSCNPSAMCLLCEADLHMECFLTREKLCKWCRLAV